MIYQAVGYKLVRWEWMPKRRGDRTSYFNVACADADHLSQRHPDLTWTVETVGASQQVRR